MYNKYYHDELLFLREMGREFARIYPEAAPMLAEAGADPDVERLLEGFSFSTARMRQKLDDELPELTHALLEMFWPHYLRPIPSFATVQMEVQPQAARDVHKIKRGTQLESLPVDGTPCRFRTTHDVTLLPLRIEKVEVRREHPPKLKFRFRLLEGMSLQQVNAADWTIRLHFTGEPQVVRSLYMACCRYQSAVYVTKPDDPQAKRVRLPNATVSPVGLRADDALLDFPGTSFAGFRLLQEYFAYPAKFMYVDIAGLSGIEQIEGGQFELTLELERLPDSMPPISKDNVQLHCVPVVNLFSHTANPIRIDLKRTSYKLRPDGSDGTHYEIYSVKKVVGLVRGTAKAREYRPLFRPSHDISDDKLFYRTLTQHAVAGDGTDVYVEFVTSDGITASPEVETISIDLMCTNRQLPTRLNIGDISVRTPDTPPFLSYRNITRPTNSVPPPLGGDLYWRLLSHLSINYMSMLSVESLRGILYLYNFPARVDRQAEYIHRQLVEGIREIKSEPATRLFEGVPVRGLSVTVLLNEDNFGGEGDMYLFGSILNEFLGQYVTLNAFSRLSVKGMKYGEVHAWLPKIGKRIIL